MCIILSPFALFYELIIKPRAHALTCKKCDGLAYPVRFSNMEKYCCRKCGFRFANPRTHN